MRSPAAFWMVAAALTVVLPSSGIQPVACADPPAQPGATRPARAARGRLTPELIKKHDKNGDGSLDQAERSAARAEQASLRTAGTPQRPAAVPGQVKTSIGQAPLTEMGADDRVRGQEGGLYGQGRNGPPEVLLKAAQRELAQVVPRDETGKPSPDGKIVLLSIGMSNTTREFSPFKERADADPQKSPRLVIVDGAQGGQAGAEWCDPDNKKTWARARQRLKMAGVTPEQVQVVWIKQAVKRPPADSMASAQALRGYLTTIVSRARKEYPNLRIAYLSSRSYGGFSDRHGEPDSFDTAFAVRWVIQDQLAGKPELNYDPACGAVKAPLLLWGPYLWADGEVPRKSDGLTWLRQDFVADGTHPSPAGQRKVVELLLTFFKSDPTARPWFLGQFEPL